MSASPHEFRPLPHAGEMHGLVSRAHEQLPDVVSAYVQELILTGAVRPGEFLRIEPIAESLGVSNTPVREGLLALRNEGFVRLVPRRGFVVAAMGRDDIYDLYWVASGMAGELAARAARSGNTERLESAAASICGMRRALEEGDLYTVAACGHDFHRQINLAAASGRLSAILKSVVNRLPLRLYASIEAQLGDTIDAHGRIQDAVRLHDPRKAGALMAEHVLAGADRLIAGLEARGVPLN